MSVFDEIIHHVQNQPIVKDLKEQINTSKLLPFYMEFSARFDEAPAATTQHHNFTHGLLLHTAEVWQAARAFLVASPKSAGFGLWCNEDIAAVEGGKKRHHDFWFTPEELFNAVLLHDFAKIVQYEPSGSFSWKKVRMVCNQETWTLRELSKYGIELTDNELVGLLGAEGGYSEYEVDWRPITALVHAADLWSSQAMRAFWDPAKAQDIRCPSCKAPMAMRNGTRGAFYGCTEYPKCNGITNITQTKPMENIFLDFLKKNYPLPQA